MVEGFSIVNDMLVELAEKKAIEISQVVQIQNLYASIMITAVDQFGQHHLGGVVVIELNTLAQPDSGDVDPRNPKARPDGLVLYGPESFALDWQRWFLMSLAVIQAVRSSGPVWVFTHRPLVAAARWHVNHREEKASKGAFDALDPTLLPYCIFEDGADESWVEIPRPS
jgi:hypothetical protein